ncbi:hypothetical protein FA95DRAFT_1575508 [Auriscalpium vulgare]|uniref:Uncharacterized protein n=1 Tax=Auriscalpium vulgare TaxID=40419 RepID=A0ACB8REZ5_9AGAM|nr:hypothetical protein FA95DRAFT_1575508 [Auriscalpium vulgare]
MATRLSWTWRARAHAPAPVARQPGSFKELRTTFSPAIMRTPLPYRHGSSTASASAPASASQQNGIYSPPLFHRPCTARGCPGGGLIQAILLLTVTDGSSDATTGAGPIPSHARSAHICKPRICRAHVRSTHTSLTGDATTGPRLALACAHARQPSFVLMHASWVLVAPSKSPNPPFHEVTVLRHPRCSSCRPRPRSIAHAAVAPPLADRGQNADHGETESARPAYDAPAPPLFGRAKTPDEKVPTCDEGGDAGIRCFSGVDALGAILEDFAESGAVSMLNACEHAAMVCGRYVVQGVERPDGT